MLLYTIIVDALPQSSSRSFNHHRFTTRGHSSVIFIARHRRDNNNTHTQLLSYCRTAHRPRSRCLSCGGRPTASTDHATVAAAPVTPPPVTVPASVAAPVTCTGTGPLPLLPPPYHVPAANRSRPAPKTSRNNPLLLCFYNNIDGGKKPFDYNIAPIICNIESYYDTT